MSQAHFQEVFSKHLRNGFTFMSPPQLFNVVSRRSKSNSRNDSLFCLFCFPEKKSRKFPHNWKRKAKRNDPKGAYHDREVHAAETFFLQHTAILLLRQSLSIWFRLNYDDDDGVALYIDQFAAMERKDFILAVNWSCVKISLAKNSFRSLNFNPKKIAKLRQWKAEQKTSCC